MLLNEIFNKENNAANKEKGISLLIHRKEKKFSFLISLFQSVVIHIILFLIVLLIFEFLSVILRILGFDINLFERPSLKTRDIEFILINPEKYQFKKNKFNLSEEYGNLLMGKNPDNTQNNDDAALKGDADKIRNQSEAVNRNIKEDTRKATTQTNIPLSKKKMKGNYIPKTKTPNSFSIAEPDMDEITKNIGLGVDGTKGYSSPSAGKNTVLASGNGASGTKNGGNVSGTGSSKGGGGYYYGNAGAPKAGVANKYDNDGIDIDLGPYVATVQRKIMRNWKMPNDNINKKTVLFLRISKGGNLMILNVKTPSGDAINDNAAISAVKVSQPFPPLPTGYKASYADIILTFDYKVSARKN